MADKTIPALKILRGKVGVNTATPSQQLHVNGEAYIFTGSTSVRTLSGIFKADTIENSAGASNLKLQTESGGNKHIEITPNGTGNVGIGTASPSQLLHVYRVGVLEPKFQSTNGRVGLQLTAGNTGDANWILYSGYPAAGDFTIREGGVANHIVVKKTSGSVGIGTASPGSLLTISGNSDDGDNACALRIIDEDDTGGSKLPAIMFYGGSTMTGRIRGGDGTFAIAVGSTPTTAFSINTTSRKIAFGSYGSGTHTGTAAYKLAVDSSGNVIETAVGAGQVDGSGTANKLALWTDADTIGDSIITQSGTAYAQVNGGVRITGNHTDNGSQLNIWCDNSGHARAAAYDYFFYTGSNNSRTNVALFLSTTGKVGINNSNPSAKLHIGSAFSDAASDVNATNGLAIKQASTDSRYGIYLERAGERRGYYIGMGGPVDSLTFERNNVGTKADVMSLTRDGYVGIGTNNPAYTLEVKASVTGNFVSRIYNTATSGNSSGLLVRMDEPGSTGKALGVYANGGYKFTVEPDGEVQILSGAAYTTHLNYQNSGTHYITMANGGATYFRGSSNSITTMTVLGTGSVGIGGTPSTALDIFAANASSIAIRIVGGNKVQFLNASSNTNANIYNSGASGAAELAFQIAGVTKVTINNDGKVGILDTSPHTALAVNGEASFGDGSRLSLIGLNIASGAASPNIKIRTKIPFALGGADFTVNIKGFIYGNAETANLTVCWHYYNSTFYNATCSSAGGWAPTIQLSAEDWDSSGTKKVCICLSTPGYWVKMYVESMFSNNYADTYADGWTWVDGTASGTGNDLASVSYRSDFGNNFRMLSTGSVGVGVTPSRMFQVNGVVSFRPNGSSNDQHYFTTGAANNPKYMMYNSVGTLVNQFATDTVSYITGGSVGIGTNSPDSLLMVYKSGADSIIHVRGASNGGDARVRINGYNSSELYLDRNGVGRFAFRRTTGTDDLSLLKLNDNYTDNSTIMFWDYSSGSVGIGCSPTAKLEVTDATTNVAAVRVTRRSDLASTFCELGTTGGSGEVRSTDNLVLSADFDNNGGSSNIEFKVDGAQKAVIDSSGRLGIGTNAPLANLMVGAGARNAGAAVQNQAGYFSGTKSAFAGSGNKGLWQGQLHVADDSALAAGIGGAITFGATQDNTNGTYLASIEGSRDNATSGQYGASMIFRTRTNGSAVMGAHMVINSVGNVGIGTNTPNGLLNVAGNTKIGTAGSPYSGTNVTSLTINGVYPALSLGNTSNRFSILAYSTYTNYETVSNAHHVFSGGNVGVSTTSPAATLDVKQGTANNNNKLMKVADDVLSVYKVTGLSNHTVTLTCGSYFQAEVVITANQTNGGTYNNLYIRGIWSNNHTSHHWDEIENIGSLTGSSFSITVGQNDVTNSGKLTITHTYSSGSFSQMVVRVTDLYGSAHGYSIT